MINTALSSPGPNSRFFGSIHNGARPRHLARARLRHLAEREVSVQVHAAFVNTKWYEAWLERTLLLDPIIFDMWSPGVLSWAPGQPCDSHHARHTGQDTLVVPCLRFGSFLNHKSVGGRGCGQQPDAFFPLARAAAATRRILGWSPRSSLMLVVLSRHLFVCSQSTTIACVSFGVPPLLEFLLLFPSEYHHCLSFPQSIAIA